MLTLKRSLLTLSILFVSVPAASQVQSLVRPVAKVQKECDEKNLSRDECSERFGDIRWIIGTALLLWIGWTIFKSRADDNTDPN